MSEQSITEMLKFTCGLPNHRDRTDAWNSSGRKLQNRVSGLRMNVDKTKAIWIVVELDTLHKKHPLVGSFNVSKARSSDLMYTVSDEYSSGDQGAVELKSECVQHFYFCKYLSSYLFDSNYWI